MNKSDRKLVILKPASKIERFVKARFSAMIVLQSAARNPETKKTVTNIIFNSQNLATKLERIKAELTLRCESEMYSDRNLRRLGL